MKGFHTAMALISGIFYITVSILGRADYIRTGKVIFFLGIISYLVHMNRHNFYRYINQSEKVSNLPVEEIRIKNNLFLFGFLVIAAAAIFLFLLLPTEALTEMIKSVFSYIAGIFTWLVSGLFNSGEESKVEDFDFAGEAQKDFGAAQSPVWAVILDIIIKIFAFILIAALSVWLIYIIYKKLSQSFKRKRKYTEVREFILPEMLRERTKDKETKKEPGLLFDMSPNGRMRKLYVRRIKKAGKRMKIPGSYTPEEIEDFAGLAKDEERTGLHECYEKARYSKEGCNIMEVRMFRGRR